MDGASLQGGGRVLGTSRERERQSPRDRAGEGDGERGKEEGGGGERRGGGGEESVWGGLGLAEEGMEREGDSASFLPPSFHSSQH